MLRALGKRFDGPERPGHSQDLWPLATLWLEAERPPQIFLLRGHQLGPTSWKALNGALEAVPYEQVWIFVHHPRVPDCLRESADTPVIDFADFRRQTDEWRRLSGRGPRRRPMPMPTVPTDDFTVFRGLCARRFDTQAFARVDREIASGRATVQRWLDFSTAAPRHRVAQAVGT